MTVKALIRELSEELEEKYKNCEVWAGNIKEILNIVISEFYDEYDNLSYRVELK